MSARPSTGPPSTCSGARYFAVPSIAWSVVRSAPSAAFAMPKSVTRTRPSEDSRTLAGLMSRWTIPARWAASSAAATWSAMTTASSTSSGARTSIRCRSVVPATSSMTMASVPSPLHVS